MTTTALQPGQIVRWRDRDAIVLDIDQAVPRPVRVQITPTGDWVRARASEITIPGTCTCETYGHCAVCR